MSDTFPSAPYRPARDAQITKTPSSGPRPDGLDHLEADLDLKRHRIAGLVDELSTRLQPAELARQGLKTGIKSRPAQTALAAAKETYRENPVACGLAALALGYVAYQGALTFMDLNRKPASPRTPGDETADREKLAAEQGDPMPDPMSQTKFET